MYPHKVTRPMQQQHPQINEKLKRKNRKEGNEIIQLLCEIYGQNSNSNWHRMYNMNKRYDLMHAKDMICLFLVVLCFPKIASIITN